MAKRNSKASDAAQSAAEAHTNLTMWAAVATLLTQGLLYGNSDDHAAAGRVVKMAHAEQRKWLRRYDAAIAKATEASHD